MTGYLEDPRGRRSEELAFAAERAYKFGDHERAFDLFAEAAELEGQVAREVPADQPRVRSVLGISAVALWIDARRYDEAIRTACELLASPEMLTDQGREDIQSLLERAFREKALSKVIGPLGDAVPLEIKLDGGLVRRGIAPAALVRERQEVAMALVIRAAEWRARKPFRKAGAAAHDLLERVRFYEAPAVPASYGVRLYVASSAPPELPGVASDLPSPQAAVAEFLAIAAAAREGPDALRAHLTQDAYVKSFMVGFRDLAPDGTSVATVTFSSPTWRAETTPLTFEPAHRRSLTTGLLSTQAPERRVEIEGTLKVVNLRASRPFIGVETTDGDLSQFYIRRGELDDTIGPKLNRRVQVFGIRRHKSNGSIEKLALDIVLLEETAHGADRSA